MYRCSKRRSLELSEMLLPWHRSQNGSRSKTTFSPSPPRTLEQMRWTWGRKENPLTLCRKCGVSSCIFMSSAFPLAARSANVEISASLKYCIFTRMEKTTSFALRRSAFDREWPISCAGRCCKRYGQSLARSHPFPQKPCSSRPSILPLASRASLTPSRASC